MIVTGLRRGLFRAVMRAAAGVARRLPWRTGEGVIGVVLTPAGRVVLVRHTYLDGWYPPSGGLGRRETAEAAVVRELREEIGLTSWSDLKLLAPREPGLTAFVIRGAVYRRRRSLEIEEVAEFDPADLPADASPRLRRLLTDLDTSPSRAPGDGDEGIAGAAVG